MSGTQERTKAKNTGVSWFIVYTAAALPGLIRLLEHYLATDRMPLHYMALCALAAAALALPLGNLTRNKTTTFKVVTVVILFLVIASVNWLITSWNDSRPATTLPPHATSNQHPATPPAFPIPHLTSRVPLPTLPLFIFINMRYT